MKKLFIVILAVILAVGAGYYLIKGPVALKPIESFKNNQISAINQQIVGIWQSNEDIKYSRKFNADGTFSDIYNEAPAGVPGTWEVVEDENKNNELRLYSEGEVLKFKIVAVTPERLELIYLDRGGVLTYKKLK